MKDGLSGDMLVSSQRNLVYQNCLEIGSITELFNPNYVCLLLGDSG